MGAFQKFTPNGQNTILTNNLASGGVTVCLGLCSVAPSDGLSVTNIATQVGPITDTHLRVGTALPSTQRYWDIENEVAGAKVTARTAAMDFHATISTVAGVKGAYLYLGGNTPTKVMGGWVDPSGTVNIRTVDTYNVTFTAGTVISLT